MATRLDAAYDREVSLVRSKIAAYLERQWTGLGSYRDADAERLLAAIIPRVEAGQKRVAELTDAYISRVAAAELGQAVTRGAVADVTTEALRGVSAEEVYMRPFVETYTAIAGGSTFTSAVEQGKSRLLDIALSGAQLAKTHSSRVALERSGARAFQRVLTGRENCAMCTIASTQRYWRGDLLPIHPGCDCHVKPFSGDPNEQVINATLLEQMHDAVMAQFGTSDRGARFIDGDNPVSDYLDLIVVHEHGEMGPILGYRGDRFTSLSDITRRL